MRQCAPLQRRMLLETMNALERMSEPGTVVDSGLNFRDVIYEACEA